MVSITRAQRTEQVTKGPLPGWDLTATVFHSQPSVKEARWNLGPALR